MVNGGDRRPHTAAMAVLADVGGLHVQRSLAGRVSAIVTTEAVVDDIGMIEIRRHPGH